MSGKKIIKGLGEALEHARGLAGRTESVSESASPQVTLSVPVGWALVPIEPSVETIDVGRAATAPFLKIPGSALTVAREKMRRRYKAMVAFSASGHPRGKATPSPALAPEEVVQRLTAERDAEREAREKAENALRGKDEAMDILFKRLHSAGVDVSDLLS